jgi:hypothetical protein
LLSQESSVLSSPIEEGAGVVVVVKRIWPVVVAFSRRPWAVR